MRDDSLRKWQCYVCGVVQTDYDSFKTHIVNEHEQGREYLLCPACQSPVRDIKLHYQVKHPSRPLPTMQMKATLWYDFSPTGKRKTRKPKFRKGQFESKKNQMVFQYDSGWEADVFGYLEIDDDVVGYRKEPFKVPYCFNGQWHNYLPDLRVEFIDGTTELWEVKPANQMEDPVNQAKFAAAYNLTENIGWKFNVMNEQGIEKLKRKVLRKRARDSQ